MNELIIMCIILFFIYIAVLIIVLADLWSGIRKAKKAGMKIKSDKLKRTTDKIARYYTEMLALTVVDGMQLVAIWYINLHGGYSIIMFPWMTLLGAFIISGIELKSIMERIEDKEKRDAQEMLKLLIGVLKNSCNPEGVMDRVEAFIEETKNEKDEQRTKE